MSAVTVNSEQPLGGAPLSAEARLNTVNITFPSGTAQTTVTCTHPSIGPGSKVIGIMPTNASAADIGQIVPSISSTTLTLTFAQTDLAGTEVFELTILSQV